MYHVTASRFMSKPFCHHRLSGPTPSEIHIETKQVKAVVKLEIEGSPAFKKRRISLILDPEGK